ncbi:MAG TPA: serine/threonine-protein kinase [Polyangia bacterium]|nr:serine/threonine-protein kinase [Polyangia bacterium]
METEQPSIPDPRIGRVLQERYRIIAKLASGAMGVVYKGERLQLGRPVAVKFLHPWIAAQKAFLGRFENEARAMSRLSHPNCVSVIDFGHEGQPYLVMDFVTGTTLREALNAGALPAGRALHIARQLLSGLTHAHAQGIVHRDLKPDNLILSDEAGLQDYLRILDFGLAKLRDGPAMTAGLTIGTPSYMAPEQIGGAGVIDARSDLYSVGVVLFELLTGRKPFVSDHIGDLLLMQQEAPVPAMAEVAPGVRISQPLEQVVRRALAKVPADRFQSAGEFTQAIDRTPEGRTPEARNPETRRAPDEGDATIVDPSVAREIAAAAGLPAPAQPLPPQRQPSGRRAQLVGAALFLFVGVALTAGVLLRYKPSRTTVAVSSPPNVKAASSSPAAASAKSSVAEARSPSVPPAPSSPPPGPTPAAPAEPPPATDPAADYHAALLELQQRRWAQGLGAAEKAVRADPALRSDPALLKAVVASLASDKTHERSQLFLRRAGSAATPILKDAAHHDPSAKVRERAAEMLDTGGHTRPSFFGSTQRSSSSSSFFKR